MHLSIDTKVIGYFAYSQDSVFCGVDSCIIAGSEALMKNYLQLLGNSNKSIRDTIRKSRFGEIYTGLRQGASYSFDKESYSRFLPLIETKHPNESSVDDFEEKCAEEGTLELIEITLEKITK